MLKTVTPIDNSILVERNFATDTEIETVIQNAYDARKEWRETSLPVSYTHLTLPTICSV